MSRLIDADRLLDRDRIGRYYHSSNYDIAISIMDIKNAPTVDAVEVVRCKDCKYSLLHKRNPNFLICEMVEYMTVAYNDYCSYGEKK